MKKNPEVLAKVSRWARPVPHPGTGEVSHPHEKFAWDCWHVGGPREPDDAQKAEIAAAKAREARHIKAKEDSFQSCDTDGFLSQWASGICANEERIRQRILENGGLDYFPGLYTLDGRRVRARLIHGKFRHRDTHSWMCLDENGRATGVYIPDSRGPNSKLSKNDLVVVAEWVPAKAGIAGEGCGLSGSAWACSQRLDGGCPEDAPVILRK